MEGPSKGEDHPRLEDTFTGFPRTAPGSGCTCGDPGLLTLPLKWDYASQLPKTVLSDAFLSEQRYEMFVVGNFLCPRQWAPLSQVFSGCILLLP